jgi:hypothetical protein
VNKREEDDMADAEWPDFEPHGFASTPIWGGVKKPKITLKFKDGVTVGHKLDGNEDRTIFDALELVPKEWQMHGIKNVRVKIEGKNSVIDVYLRDRDEPLRCTKDYT